VHGRPHPDRARQFMPFAALKGYYELIAQRTAQVMAATEAAERGGDPAEDVDHVGRGEHDTD